MASRPEGPARYADRFVLAACVLISLWLLSLNEPARLSVATRVAHGITTPVEWAGKVAGSAISLKRDNEKLRSELAAIALDRRYIEHQRAQLEELERRAGFYEESQGRLLPATVLEMKVGRIPVQAKIRSHGGDSLRAWLPVVSEAGLVGRIRKVLNADHALVQLLTDPESRISVEVEGSGVTGLLRHDGLGFVVDQVPRGEEISVGDRLVSSGLGGTVPRGIPIGQVKQRRSPATELFQYVELEPAVRFSALDQVYVITRPGPWYTLSGGGFQDSPVPTDSSAISGEVSP